MEIEVLDAKSLKTIAKIPELSSTTTIEELKDAYAVIKPGTYPSRQSFRQDPKGKSLKDSDTLLSIGLAKGGKLYYKDLGPQVGWSTVFLTEYAGPLVIYLLFYPRPAIFYGPAAASVPRAGVVNIAAFCWTFHYTKRLLETLFVHRFSHATMPIMNIFRNSAYYWGFAAFVSYFVNHPFYTPPVLGNVMIYGGLLTFMLCELGNLSVHICFRNLRPEGSKVRKIPRAAGDPLTALFGLVSCPNYTYEAGAWLSFAAMTQSLPALMFALAGLYQMSLWALGKHRNYKREFKDYPKKRRAIIPFLL